MRVLVTGSEGYIGSVLMDVLKEHGHDPVGLDAGWFFDCLLYPATSYNTHSVDLRQVDPHAVRGIDAVCHLAGLCNDPLGDIDERLTYNINIYATKQLAALAKLAGVTRFVFSSSCSMYGAQSGDHLAIESCSMNPQTAYARAKVTAEYELSQMADDKFSPTFLRNATVYGLSPRLRVDVVANNLLGSAVATGEIRVLSDGSPWRPIVHVKDVCQAFVRTIEAPREVVHNEAFNIGSSAENYQVKDIANTIARATSAEVHINKNASPDTRSYRVDFSKAEHQLGFQTRFTLADSLLEMIGGYTDNGFDNDALTGHRFNRLLHVKHLQSNGDLTSDLSWRHQ